MEGLPQQQQKEAVALPLGKEKYTPFEIKKHGDLEVGSDEFRKRKRHVFIMTEAGRPVYVRYGDEMEASSFVATMGAILEKYRIYFFADGKNTSSWQKMVLDDREIYFIQRKCLVYVCVSEVENTQAGFKVASNKEAYQLATGSIGQNEENDGNLQQFNGKKSKGSVVSEYLIKNMLDFVNIQMVSILTDIVNKKLQQRSNYDPIQTLGDRNQLIGTAIKNGFSSPSIVFGAFMALPLQPACRKIIHATLGDAVKDTQAIVAMLLTPNYVVDIFKQKGFTFRVQDILLLQNLMQAQTSLRNSENWIPLCLPGMSADGLLYCYLSFLQADLALIMLSDQNELFYKCRDAKAQLFEKLQSPNNNTLQPILQALSSLPYSHKISQNQSSTIKHFIVLQQETHQISLPSCTPYGKQSKQFRVYLAKYAQHYMKFLAAEPALKSEYFAVTRDQTDYSGIYSTADYVLFFVLDKFVSIPEINAQLNLLFKWIKIEEQIKFISKFS